jgi:predicted ribosomally synthesized peptide with SipW-like signal peptide
MKRILISLVVIAAVGAAGFGVTRAYFTGSATSTGNTFTTGTVNISLAGDASLGAAYFSIGALAPGDSIKRYVAVHNSGSMELLFRGFMETVSATEVGGETLASQLNVKITLNPSDSDSPSGLVRFAPVTDYVIYNGPLSGIVGAGTSLAMDNDPEAFIYGAAQRLQPGSDAVYKVEVSLPFSTGNDWQGASYVGNLVFQGVQFSNQTQGDVKW